MTLIASVQKMSFRYQPNEPLIFDNFSWSIERGERWAIIGPSGCGKSTLLYLLAGLRQAEAGQVLVENSAVKRPRASTGLILQTHGLLPWATVRDNVRLGIRIGRLYRYKKTQEGVVRPYPPPDIPFSRADEWLERLGIAEQAQQYPSQISGGQKQRVAIARTMLLNPALLLMDEPFSALDAFTREDLQRLTVNLTREQALTTVLVTHDIDEAAFMATHILVLHQPPNRSAHIMLNPEAGNAGYRTSSRFFEMTTELRRALRQHT